MLGLGTISGQPLSSIPNTIYSDSVGLTSVAGFSEAGQGSQSGTLPLSSASGLVETSHLTASASLPLSALGGSIESSQLSARGSVLLSSGSSLTPQSRADIGSSLQLSSGSALSFSSQVTANESLSLGASAGFSDDGGSGLSAELLLQVLSVLSFDSTVTPAPVATKKKRGGKKPEWAIDLAYLLAPSLLLVEGEDPFREPEPVPVTFRVVEEVTVEEDAEGNPVFLHRKYREAVMSDGSAVRQEIPWETPPKGWLEVRNALTASVSSLLFVHPLLSPVIGLMTAFVTNRVLRRAPSELSRLTSRGGLAVRAKDTEIEVLLRRIADDTLGFAQISGEALSDLFRYLSEKAARMVGRKRPPP